MISSPAAKRKRSGFTLIELLIVISIVVLLMSLSISAVMRFSDSGPRTATRSNLKRLKTTLDTQWKAVVDKAREPIPSTVNVGFPLSDPRARANYVSLKLAQAFPTSFAEAFAPGGNLPAYSGYVAYLGTLGITPANVAKDKTSAEVQMAVCLMMIVERGPFNTPLTPDAIGTTGAQQLVLGNGGLAWGCVDAFTSRADSAGVTQPAGPILFTRTFLGAALTPGILSAGPDREYGVDFATLNSTNDLKARDNLSPNDS